MVLGIFLAGIVGSITSIIIGGGDKKNNNTIRVNGIRAHGKKLRLDKIDILPTLKYGDSPLLAK